MLRDEIDEIEKIVPDKFDFFNKVVRIFVSLP